MEHLSDNTEITDIVFADDAAIFAESLGVLLMALETLHEEVKCLGLKVSWAKTSFRCLEAYWREQSVHECGQDIEILENFTYLGNA